MGWFNNKCKEEVYDTSIGIISKTTLKHNPKLIRRMFEEKIREEKRKYESVYEKVVLWIEENALEQFGEFNNDRYSYHDYHLRRSVYYNKTKKSRAYTKKIIKNTFKKTEFLNNIERITELEKEMKKLLGDE